MGMHPSWIEQRSTDLENWQQRSKWHSGTSGCYSKQGCNWHTISQLLAQWDLIWESDIQAPVGATVNRGAIGTQYHNFWPNLDLIWVLHCHKDDIAQKCKNMAKGSLAAQILVKTSGPVIQHAACVFFYCCEKWTLGIKYLCWGHGDLKKCKWCPLGIFRDVMSSVTSSMMSEGLPLCYKTMSQKVGKKTKACTWPNLLSSLQDHIWKIHTLQESVTKVKTFDSENLNTSICKQTPPR